jgi:hypothetical protein
VPADPDAPVVEVDLVEWSPKVDSKAASGEDQPGEPVAT